MATHKDWKLFSPVQVGPLTLSHRVVMGPLTRSRSKEPGDIPSDLMVEYYGQRASEAGLIISEATTISITGRGWFGAPGMYSDKQVDGWKKVTGAVHAKRGRMFSQLWHTGRSSHIDMTNGAMPVAPSVVPDYWLDSTPSVSTPSGWVKPSPHRALGISEIPGIVEDYRKAAERAKAAGFDGVELHAANGYPKPFPLLDGSSGSNGIGVGRQPRRGANCARRNVELDVGQQPDRTLQLPCRTVEPVRTRVSPHH